MERPTRMTEGSSVRSNERIVTHRSRSRSRSLESQSDLQKIGFQQPVRGYSSLPRALQKLGVCQQHVPCSDCRVETHYHGGNGSMIRQGIMHDQSLQESTMQLWTLPAGASEGWHIHGSADSDRLGLGMLEEIYYCRSGDGCVGIKTSEGVVHDVPFRKGDAILVPSGVWHDLRNQGASPLSLIVVWGPPSQGSERLVPINESERPAHCDNWLEATTGVKHVHIPTGPRIVEFEYKDGFGDVIRQGVLDKASKQSCTLQLWTLLAGASEGLHVHGESGGDDSRPNKSLIKAPLEELYYCLSGVGSIPTQDLNGQVHKVPFREGDAVLVPAGVWHGVSNEGLSALEILILWGSPLNPRHDFVRGLKMNIAAADCEYLF